MEEAFKYAWKQLQSYVIHGQEGKSQMRIRELFKWALCGTVFGKLAFLYVGSVPGRPRVPVPPPSEGIYGRADLEQEFIKDPLPPGILDLFEEAARSHLAGYLKEALDSYFGLGFEDQDGSQVFLSEGSAVVAYNIHLAYEAAGAERMHESDYYLDLYYRLLDEAVR